MPHAANDNKAPLRYRMARLAIAVAALGVAAAIVMAVRSLVER